MKSRNLTDFPDNFDPLIVVTGDRREDRPKTKGDLLAYSLSSIDITYLLNLGLKNVEIVTDKVFVLEDFSELKKRFGRTNILTIGSPAVNLLTRKINNSNLFYFNIPNNALSDERKHQIIFDEIKYDQLQLQIYKEIFERGLTPEEIIKQDLIDYADKRTLAINCKNLFDRFNNLNLAFKSWKPFIRNFDRPGIYDPFDKTIHGYSTRPYNDFGLISITLNPYSEGDFFIITVAGIHGIASAHGLRLLSDKDELELRPFGGVFEIIFPEYTAWSEKLKNAQIKWQTKAYSKDYYKISDIVEIIQSRTKKEEFGFFISTPFKKDDEYYKNLNEKIKNYLEEYFQNTETAYSLKYNRPNTFAKYIKNRIEGSYAIIHILNDYKPGVLFEIGLSIGLKKIAYLIWDKNINELNISELPKAIIDINIMIIDTSNETNLKEIIQDNIIKPSIQLKEEVNYNKLETTGCIVEDVLQEKLSNNYLYLYISSSLTSYKKDATKIISDNGYTTFADTELKGDGYIKEQCYGIINSKVNIFILDDQDLNGIVLLGVSAAIKKDLTCVISKKRIAMWDGKGCQFKEATIQDDINQRIGIFLRKVFNSRS
ncbi:MAG: hypothetical protein ACFFC3_13335 [Candidatus Odinarchaeota archaeon]